MNNSVVIITGAAGFLGSAITVDLANDHLVFAIDRRAPSRALRETAPGAIWSILDIADSQKLSAAFQHAKAHVGRIDFVIHFAAFYHFGSDWRYEYERTNVDGTVNVLEAAQKAGVQRVIFASSIAAMAPPPVGFLTENTPVSDWTPYAKSKSLGEKLLSQAQNEIPSAILRIGGVFSDWCELPPLFSLIRRWTGQGPFSRLAPGRGASGIPYIHRDDLVAFVRACLLSHNRLRPFQVLLASQHGVVHHKQLFVAVRRAAENSASLRPILIPPKLAAVGLSLQRALGTLTGHMPFEQLWMLDCVDKPWQVDTTQTRKVLNWDCTPGLGVLDKIPIVLGNLKSNPQEWEERNRRRNEAGYSYSPS